ncbi:KIF-binding protein [Tribolium castaneum]|uniref:KIF-binding protein n=1 Tax=Tribolium castaneum TaxID=7070 RepID=D2A380_TRICA|nr:PREDICTED: KIF1-binding protein homolog [Tribolium castaneum]EFA01949.1 Protein KBP homolog-like Protein [Tribolium castaneum]|eukprot:XP_974525.1 PREDICTED: KIF1-binding protein homolog [Tribolium castaneum]
MTASKEVFVDLEEKFNKVLKLLEDSKYDPENQPFVSKYAASETLVSMKASLENVIETQPDNDKIKLTAMLGSVYLYLGMTSIATEELSTGEGYLAKCEDLIKDCTEEPQVVMVTLNMYNQFGILWSQREPEKSKTYLEKAERLYATYKKSNVPPVDIKDLFNPNFELNDIETAWINFEKVYTLTVYYLAQIYGALKDALKSAVYCHNTLQRQLDSGDYESIDWALNAATLSQFLMEQNGFKQARHHLAASSLILDEYAKTLDAITERNEAFDAKMEVFKHRSADIARCWAKYGLLLLSKSKERLLNHTDDIDKNCTLSSDLTTLTLDSDASVTSADLQNLQFTSLDLARYENQITYKFILTIQDARHVFLNIQNWLQKAEAYYTLETLASDHLEIVQDKSQMYLNLLFFEDNPENQSKLHKRRIDLLENIIKNVNPQYYLQYCRQIWYELAQTYCDILNIKSDKLRESKERPSPHVLAKINHLIESSIFNFTCFIDSFKEGAGKELPGKIPSDSEKAFLQAYFHIAALNSRFITLDKNVQLKNVESSLNMYKKVLDYCNVNEKAAELIPMELGICKEMVTLLPVKIAKLKQEVS